MTYIDGFVLAVPRQNVEAYRALASKAGKIWMEFGALSYVEAVADDVKPGKLTSFPQSVMLKEDEVVVFAWITYPSREERDRINALVMEDPRLKEDAENMPFDGARMIFGGFEAIVEY